MTKQQPRTIRYEDSYKQARLFCLRKNGTVHNYRYPNSQEFFAILKIFMSFNPNANIEIAICNECRHLKFINYELPDRIFSEEVSINETAN